MLLSSSCYVHVWSGEINETMSWQILGEDNK